jgi:hypothetical protein
MSFWYNADRVAVIQLQKPYRYERVSTLQLRLFGHKFLGFLNHICRPYK